MTPRRRLPEWAKARSHPRDPKIGLLKPRRCDLYLPGHTVHWIQGRDSHTDAGATRFALLSDGDGEEITLDFGHEVRRYRNHEVERLVESIGLGGFLVPGHLLSPSRH